MWDVLAHARPRCHIGMRSQGGGSEPQQQQQQHHVGPSSRVCLFNELPAAKYLLWSVAVVQPCCCLRVWVLFVYFREE